MTSQQIWTRANSESNDQAEKTAERLAKGNERTRQRKARGDCRRKGNSFSFCTKPFVSFNTTITKTCGAIAIKRVRIAKRNVEKVLSGPVERRRALEQETQEQRKEQGGK